MGAATAIHAVRRMRTPVLIELDVQGVGVITIDPQHHVYSGHVNPSLLPLHPSTVVVETRATSRDAGALERSARSLDSLLWAIGVNAFGNQRATWLWPDDRYRLTRWPNLSGVVVEGDHVRMFGILAHAFATPEELAATAECDVAQARRLINALSLIGILKTSSDAPPPQPASTPVAHRGLISRLRARMGI